MNDMNNMNKMQPKVENNNANNNQPSNNFMSGLKKGFGLKDSDIMSNKERHNNLSKKINDYNKMNFHNGYNYELPMSEKQHKKWANNEKKHYALKGDYYKDDRKDDDYFSLFGMTKDDYDNLGNYNKYLDDYEKKYVTGNIDDRLKLYNNEFNKYNDDFWNKWSNPENEYLDDNELNQEKELRKGETEIYKKYFPELMGRLSVKEYDGDGYDRFDQPTLDLYNKMQGELKNLYQKRFNNIKNDSKEFPPVVSNGWKELFPYELLDAKNDDYGLWDYQIENEKDPRNIKFSRKWKNKTI